MSHTGHVYAVHKGRKTGIYLYWEGEGGCNEQVHKYEGAVFKKFKSVKKASEFVKNGSEQESEKKRKIEKDDTDEYYRVPSDRACDRDKEPLVVYVDGSVKIDPQGIPRGGYGVWFGQNDPRNLKEKFPLPNHTNNRCEVMAARRAIEVVTKNNYIDDDAELIIMTDSNYVINSVKAQGGNWKGGSIKNFGLLKSLYTLTQLRPVTFMHIYSHSGNKGNEGADKLAKEGAQ